jgi:hypothetical protein
MESRTLGQVNPLFRITAVMRRFRCNIPPGAATPLSLLDRFPFQRIAWGITSGVT